MSTYECLMPHCHADVYERHECCDDCWEDRRGQLASLPDLYVMTYAMLTPGSRMQEIADIHVAAVDPAAPINLVALDSLMYGYQRLSGWAAWARRRAGAGDLRLSRHTSGAAFLTVVRVLQLHDGKLVRWSGEYVLDVWTTYRRLVIQTLPAEPRHLSVPCPVCDCATVLTRHADEYALCLTCGTTWPHSQLPMLRRQAQRARTS
jgi:ribosomal protein S27E